MIKGKFLINLFLLFFLLVSIVCFAPPAYADTTCVGTIDSVSVNEADQRYFYKPSWHSNNYHYLCPIGDQAEAVCKTKYATLMTAVALGKEVSITYPGDTPCNGNNTGNIPVWVTLKSN